MSDATRTRGLAPLVYIVIVNWNGLTDTLECLESVEGLAYPNFKVVVVDNGSTDGSAQIISRTFPRVMVRRNDRNLGFAQGTNMGVRQAFENGAAYAWLLNNDTTVAPDALDHLVGVAESGGEIGMVGSKIYFHGRNKIIWFAGGIIRWRNGFSDHIGLGDKDVGQYDSLFELERLTGCSMLVKKSVYQRVGLMDEKYFLYAEELDWCVRARKQGFKCVFAPRSLVYHKVSGSTKRNWPVIYSYYNTRNILETVRKNFSFPRMEFYLLTITASKIWSIRREIVKWLIVAATRTRRYSYDLSAMRGIYDFFTRRMGFVNIQNLFSEPDRKP